MKTATLLLLLAACSPPYAPPSEGGAADAALWYSATSSCIEAVQLGRRGASLETLRRRARYRSRKGRAAVRRLRAADATWTSIRRHFNEQYGLAL